MIPTLFSPTTQSMLTERGWSGPMTIQSSLNLERTYMTPLMIAVRKQHNTPNSSEGLLPNLELAKRLLEEGVNVYDYDRDGLSVWAYCYDVLNTAPLLLDYWTNLHYLNKDGQCFFHEFLAQCGLRDMQVSEEKIEDFLKMMIGRLFQANFDFHQPDNYGESLFSAIVNEFDDLEGDWDEAWLNAYLCELERQQLASHIPQPMHSASLPTKRI